MPFASLLRKAAVAFVLALGLAGPAAVPANAQGTVLLSYGPDFGQPSQDRWRGGYLTLEQRPDRVIWSALSPIYSFGISGKGDGYVSAGLRADVPLGQWLLTPHFSLAFYQASGGGFDSRELIQFRTGFDAFVPVTQQVWLGLGYYHMSNAGITRKSADLDVVRLGVLWRY